jgi:hypothetical protein
MFFDAHFTEECTQILSVGTQIITQETLLM